MKNQIKRILCAVFSVVLAILSCMSISALGNVIYSGADGCGKRIAITFDDGPHPRKTAEVLSVLAEYSVRATFFVVGENAKYYPDLVMREAAEGHEIGNHTYHHKPMRKCKEGEGKCEITEASDMIKSITGKAPVLFRPPEGSYSSSTVELARACGCDIVLWNVDTRDWAMSKTEEIVANVKKNVCNGSIILFHDFTRDGSHTVEALKILLPYLRSEGYEFVTVSELIR